MTSLRWYVAEASLDLAQDFFNAPGVEKKERKAKKDIEREYLKAGRPEVLRAWQQCWKQNTVQKARGRRR